MDVKFQFLARELWYYCQLLLNLCIALSAYALIFEKLLNDLLKNVAHCLARVGSNKWHTCQPRESYPIICPPWGGNQVPLKQGHEIVVRQSFIAAWKDEQGGPLNLALVAFDDRSSSNKFEIDLWPAAPSSWLQVINNEFMCRRSIRTFPSWFCTLSRWLALRRWH